MPGMNLKSIIPLLLMAALAIGLTITGEYFGHQLDTRQNQITEIIAPEAALSLIQDNQGSSHLIILDVRTTEELAECYIEGAINLDYRAGNFKDICKALAKDKVYIVYCQSGSRGEQTLALLAVLNFPEVYSISGGMNAWRAGGLPVVE